MSDNLEHKNSFKDSIQQLIETELVLLSINDPLILLLKLYSELDSSLIDLSYLTYHGNCKTGGGDYIAALSIHDLEFINSTHGELGNNLEFDQVGIIELSCNGVTTQCNTASELTPDNVNVHGSKNFLEKLESCGYADYTTLSYSVLLHLNELSAHKLYGEFNDNGIYKFTAPLSNGFCYSIRMNYKLIQLWYKWKYCL